MDKWDGAEIIVLKYSRRTIRSRIRRRNHRPFLKRKDAFSGGRICRLHTYVIK